MSISERYITILEQKKTELEHYLKESIQGIILPEQVAVSVRCDSQQSQSLKISHCILGAGVACAIGGLVAGKPLLTVVGLAIVGVGGVGVRNNRTKENELQQNTQEYYQITSKVYGALSSIQKHLFEGWDNCTTIIKNQIKSEINRLNIEDEVKNRAIQSILNTSVIEISMLDVSQTLGKIEQKGDYAAYRQYLCTFEQDCFRAIKEAFDEQVDIYNNLNSIL